MGALSDFDRDRLGVNLIAEVEVGLDVRAWKDWTVPFNSAKYVVLPGVTAGGYEVVEVLENGSAMTSAAGPVAVHGAAGSFYQDYSTGILYARESSGDIHDAVIVPRVKLYFGTATRVLNDRVYDGRISGVPTISERIEPTFGGVLQNGGGALELINADGFFDGWWAGYKQGDGGGFLWEGAKVTLKYGADAGGAEMAFSDYRTLGTWQVAGATLTDANLSLELEDTKAKLNRRLPVSVYKREDYPKIREKDIGEPIPLAYGVCRGVAPALIDPGARKFKVAGHAIHSFKEVRVVDEDNERWNVVAFESQDVANGEFTLAEADWENDRGVSVDFVGKAHADGYPMVNAADVIEDVLSEIGETDLVTADFSTAEGVLDLGPNNHNERTVEMPINLHIDADTEAGEIIGKIARTAGLYVSTNTAGQWTVTVFQPEQGENQTRITENEMLDCSESRSITQAVSEVSVKYSRNETEDRAQSETVERTRTRYQYAAGIDLRATEEPLLETLEPARHWGQRFLHLEGKPQVFYKLRLPARYLNLKPGGFLWIDDDKRGRDEVVEILATKLNLGSATTIDVTVGLLRGYARHAGYWMDAGDTLPARQGGGSVDWPVIGLAESYVWLPQNAGHWCEDNGKVDDVTFESSRWV